MYINGVGLQKYTISLFIFPSSSFSPSRFSLSTSTGGLRLSEKLDISPEIFDFAVGLSLFSFELPSVGVAGFGRGLSLLPSQLKLHRFSYYLVSGTVGYLNLNTSSIDGFSFTPFLKNNPEYYCVGVRNIKVDV